MSAHEDAQNRPEEESINIVAFSIIPFKEALNSDVKENTESAYVKIGKKGEAAILLPVRVNTETNAIYMWFQFCTNHIDKLTKGNVRLCRSFNDEGRLVKVHFIKECDANNKTDSALQFGEDRKVETLTMVIYEQYADYIKKEKDLCRGIDPENIQLAINLCGEEKNVYVPPIDYYISPAEVLVVTSIRYCVYREHTLIKGTASVNVLKNGAVKEATLPVL